MKYLQSIRIALLLLAIFGAGLATGRLSAPAKAVAVQAGDGRQVTALTQLEMLKRQLKLDANQTEKVKPLLEEAVERISSTAVGSPERITLFLENVAKLRGILRPEQQAELDRLVQETERRHRQLFRGKAGARQR